MLRYRYTSTSGVFPYEAERGAWAYCCTRYPKEGGVVKPAISRSIFRDERDLIMVLYTCNLSLLYRFRDERKGGIKQLGRLRT